MLEFLVNNPVCEMRSFIGGMIKVAIQTIYNFEKELISKLLKINPDIEICLDKQRTLPYLLTFVNTYIKFFKENVSDYEILV